MFVPVDDLMPILEDLVSTGRESRAPRPWVGIHVSETEHRLYVTGVTTDGPGARAGIQQGDAGLSIEGVPVETLSDLYRTLWGAGEAGIEIRYTLLRDDDVVTVRVTSGDRYAFLDLPQRH